MDGIPVALSPTSLSQVNITVTGSVSSMTTISEKLAGASGTPGHEEHTHMHIEWL